MGNQSETVSAMWMALEVDTKVDEQWRHEKRASVKGFIEDAIPQLSGLWPPGEACDLGGADTEEEDGDVESASAERQEGVQRAAKPQQLLSQAVR